MDRLKQVVSHLIPDKSNPKPAVHYKHELNPTYFLYKAAQINPGQQAILHYTSIDTRIERDYATFSERAKNLSYYLRDRCFKQGNQTVALLASNTPMILEAYFAIGAARGVFAAVNYRLQKHEIQYIVRHSGAGTVIVDREYYAMVSDMDLRIIIDEDTDGRTGQYEDCIREGAKLDGGRGWEGLTYEHVDEDETIGICYTRYVHSLKSPRLSR
jgi:long-subunit acyl-CoA synthetase (AMP-forming)